MSNILRQLLWNSYNLQSLHLQLVDSLDDIVWSEIVSSNPLDNLISLTLDQCHCISGDVLQDIITRYLINTLIDTQPYLMSPGTMISSCSTSGPVDLSLQLTEMLSRK